MNNQYLLPKTILELHIEITNKCNAACPMCARNRYGYGLNPNMILSDWEEGDAELVFSNDLPNLKKVFFCGTHGDPVASSSLISAIKVCKERNLSVEIFTNGSLRSEEWWKNLVGMLSYDDTIIFAIDGLTTNHLYRQNTDINKIMKNLKICCDSKVKTQWDFLVFEHNEHELDACMSKSKEMGVNSFRIKKTARFKDDTFPVKNSQNEITHYLKPPTNPKYIHPDYHIMQKLEKNIIPEYKIQCMYQEVKKIYVNSKLEVYPCCYIGDNRENGNINTRPNELFVPYEEMNLRNKNWQEILSNSFFSNDLVDSFTGSTVINRCIKTCGVVKRELHQVHRE
jgi:MoaA/NifB/PqqE/SkfB family radical SAM enzyme